jgi:pyruvate dehydrogenase E2 component (dihydrolipoyllysine-residue acetyltransferase)
MAESAAAAAVTLVVPDLGDFSDVDVIDVLVKAGDEVAIDTPLITLETDKATMDVPSTAAGTVRELRVGKGDKVSRGDAIAVLQPQAGGGTAADAAGETSPVATPAGQATAPSASSASTRDGAGPMVDVVVPDLGDFEGVEVIDVLVKVGDEIEIDTPLITLETEKATMDVPATAAGRIVEVEVRKGDKVSRGDLILRLRGSAQAAVAPAAALEPEVRPQKTDRSGGEPSAAAVPAPERAQTLPPPASPPRIDEPGFARAHASPSVRKFARELGVDLVRVQGSGAKGRITHDDVKAWVKGVLVSGASGTTAGTAAAWPRVPEVDFAKFGPVSVEPLGRIQRISGPRLAAAWVNVPHVWQMDEADITALEETRGQLKDAAATQGIKLTPLAFIVRAVVRTLAAFPRFNASLEPGGQALVLKQYVHIGFAADTPRGLVVPVIHDADRMDIYELARALASLSEKARDAKLSPTEMQGGCFTISSLGGIGGTAFTPIINAPEVAILGVSRASMKAVFREGQFEPRLVLPFTLAYDHRVVDGADAVRFTTRLAAELETPAGLVAAVPEPA